MLFSHRPPFHPFTAKLQSVEYLLIFKPPIPKTKQLEQQISNNYKNSKNRKHPIAGLSCVYQR